MLTQDRLKSVLDYDPNTGYFTWMYRDDATSEWNRKCAGKQLGRMMGRDRYLQVWIDGEKFYGHRLAFLYMTGEIPLTDIDHVDGVCSNNAWGNLRAATRAENRHNTGTYRNNQAGLKGVCFHEKAGKWTASVMKDRKAHYLGLYDTPEAAHVAYCKAAAELHGAFFRSA